MEFQFLFPPSVAELAIAISFTAILAGLLWTVSRLMNSLGGLLTPPLLTTGQIILQGLLVLGGMLLAFAFAGANVAWLLLLFTLASIPVARIYGRKKADAPPLDQPSEVQPVAPAPTPSQPVAPADIQPIVAPQPALSAPVAEDDDSEEANEEPFAIETPLPVTTAADTALSVSAPASVSPSTTIAPEDPTPTDEQASLPALPVLRPWQQRTPAPLQRRQPLGKQTITALQIH